MRSFRVRDGDLDIGAGRRAEFVDGEEKLMQDLSLWLLEPLGIGPTTPNFGSQLPDMVGAPDAEEEVAEVESEVGRILSIYQANQIERLREARDRGVLQNWSKSEILNDIVSVTARSQDDAINVDAVIVTAAKAELSISAQVTDEGVEV